MKKYIPILSLSLLICLFIYVFYRTEKTLVNQTVIFLFSHKRYSLLKDNIQSLFPLSEWIVYSLPEGLWIFCITILSGPFYIKLRRNRINLVFIPLVVAVFMEIAQLLHILNGYFDWMDILLASGFWRVAYHLTKNAGKEPVFRHYDTKRFCCMFCYCIVYLAHVFY